MLTGPNHAGVELHGFLSYLIRCNVEGREYKVYGYKGKQVRDNIHAKDVSRVHVGILCHSPGAERWNLADRSSAQGFVARIAFALEFQGRDQTYVMLEANRIGDHICYYSDLRKIRAHYPGWNIGIPLRSIFEEIVEGWKRRLAHQGFAI